ncbi:MAG: glycosyltransferase [Rhodobacteraceae bacterium]|nr:glycosyltransferase [Paracoccaceae bacterium]
MSLTARNFQTEFPPNTPHPVNRARIGDLLVQSGQIDPGDLLKALVLQKHEDLRLGELLMGLGLVKEPAVLNALGEQTALPVVDLVVDPPARVLAKMMSPVIGIHQGFLIWKQVGETLVVAISDPAQAQGVRQNLRHLSSNVQFVLASRGSILRFYQTEFFQPLSEAANTRCPSALSCRNWTGRWPAFAGATIFTALLVTGLAAPSGLMQAGLLWIMIALVANSAFKLVTLLAFLATPKSAPPHARAKRLPKVSIMVPLLREKDILERLVRRMAKLNYPKELLEICLVFEEDDTETRDCLNGSKLPYWIRTIKVPKSQIQTKPRALNYALDFCRGDIIGVYDAEDAPEPDQIHRVVSSLAAAGDDVACVQCRLDYYNSSTNWISRCFTIEYAILFRVILPGLQRLRLPIPLGGTSVFFRRDRLEELGRWDAHNVTEDADLGIRLRRFGYRCVCADTTTYEEANFRILPWIRQRSRWLKGFLQTWLTHMRHPVALYQRLGLMGFLTFHVLFLGTFSSFAAAPIVLPIWAFSFGIEPAIYSVISPAFLHILITAFIGTEALLLTLGFTAIRARGKPGLWPYLPAMLLYWPIGALAAYKALYELFFRPVYWDKTRHGINDRAYQSEIDSLTAPTPATENL